MSSPEKSYRGYAEDYTVRVEVDRPLLEMVRRPINRALDLGVGTGTGIEDLIDMGIVKTPYKIIGIDLDEDNLNQARRNKHIVPHAGSPNEVLLQKGDVETLERVRTNSQQLVKASNIVHLLTAERAIPRWFEVTEPGGELAIVTGYMRDVMYPFPEEKSQIRWGLILGIGNRILVHEHDYDRDSIPPPNIPNKYSSEDIMRIVEGAGYVNIRTQIRTVELPSSAIAGLIKWGGFAQGAIPIEDVELAKQVMLESLKSPKLEGKTFPRGFFYLTAEKPA